MPAPTSPELIASAIDLVRKGSSQSDAAASVGISASTLSRAMKSAGVSAKHGGARAPKPTPKRPIAPPVPMDEAPAREGDAPEWLDRFVEGLQVGGVAELAAEFAGTTMGEFREWVKSESAEGDWRRVMRARGTGALQLIALVREAAETQWQAAAWLLSHTRNDVIGQKVAVETRALEAGDDAVTGNDVVRAMVEQIRDAGGPSAVLGRDLNDPANVGA